MTVEIATSDDSTNKHFDILSDGEKVGSIYVVEQPNENEVVIADFQVQRKRKGYGREASKQLEDFYMDSPYNAIVAANVTSEGSKFWPVLGYIQTKSAGYDLLKPLNPIKLAQERAQ